MGLKQLREWDVNRPGCPEQRRQENRAIKWREFSMFSSVARRLAGGHMKKFSDFVGSGNGNVSRWCRRFRNAENLLKLLSGAWIFYPVEGLSIVATL